ncbi:hypothetical protein AVEN_77309-1 [Araneus ventricosus]|uniref:Uncharacterized protein n=1 Tax=Araneus ventricosus TaxID=182803 RepID=A0A4Y2KEV7_ARAVE|nr:hypothetical protein AVEN_77309-1 [Araneus ventricosus]
MNVGPYKVLGQIRQKEAFKFHINPLSGSVFFVKRFQKRAIEEPLSVLKVCLPPNRKCSESAADRVSSPPLNKERLASPHGGDNRKNLFYSAWNLFKLQCQGNSGVVIWPWDNCFRKITSVA